MTPTRTKREYAERQLFAETCRALEVVVAAMRPLEAAIAAMRAIEATWSAADPVADVVSCDSTGWIPASAAAELAGRTLDCIHVWRKNSQILARKSAGRWEIDVASLRQHLRTPR